MSAISNTLEKYFNSKPVQTYFNTIKRFLPDEQKASGASAGLDIGTGECKLVELEKNKDSFELKKWTIEPIHNGDIKGTIKKIFDQLSDVPGSLYTSVFGKGTLIRYIDMPRMSLEDLKSSFAIEADKYFPFASDQIYTDCYILDGKDKEKVKEKNMAVMAAAAKKDLIDRRIKLLKELELPVEFIGLNPIALANALHVLGFQEKGQEEESVISLLDMGESVSNLTIFIDKLPRFTRDIFIGGRDFTKSISNALGISFQDAEKLKRGPGKKKEEVIKACESPLMNMTQELRLSIDYFATENNREIQRLLLTGGTSLLDGIVSGFEKNLEIKVNLWNPLASVEIKEDTEKGEIEKISLKLGVALGLALYQYD